MKIFLDYVVGQDLKRVKMGESKSSGGDGMNINDVHVPSEYSRNSNSFASIAVVETKFPIGVCMFIYLSNIYCTCREDISSFLPQEYANILRRC